MPDHTPSPVTRALDAARRKLLETGTRNRLIHVNRANARANCLNVINERADEVFSILRLQGRRMRFRALGKDKADAAGEVPLALAEAAPDEDSGRLTDHFLETPLGPDALARRLLRLAGDARTAEEEQGVNLLYLALGFLRWKEAPSSDVVREAPLVLLPVQLVRNERSSTFDLVCREDDLSTNLPLQERLRQDFAIGLPEVDEAEGWTPAQYFALVREATAGQRGWSVDADGMQLGFFSFAKLLMHRDLDPANWPEGAFAANPLLQGLLADGFEADAPFFGPQDRLDALLDPARIIQVVDADASQTKVIEEVRHGASLVVQGPPGTGKSQTITNLIAAAAHDGKSVLFVAEKMAALSVVHDRLVKAGLRDVCLELHSRTANKKALALELGRTLSASAQALPGVGDPARLRRTRDELNRIAELLHAALPPSGQTPFRALAEIVGFIGKGAPPPAIALDGLETLDGDAQAAALAAIEAHVGARARTGPPDRHPFRGTQAIDLQPPERSRLQGELDAAVSELDALTAEAAPVAQALQQPAPETLTELGALCAGLACLANPPTEPPADAAATVPLLFAHAAQPRLLEGLQAGADWAAAQQAAAADFATVAWTADVAALRPALAKGQASFLYRIFGSYRRASAELATLLAAPLPGAAAERLALADRLLEVQARRRRLTEEEPALQAVLGPEWRGERTPFAALLRTARWLAGVRRTIAFSSPAQLLGALAALPDPAGTAAALRQRAAGCRERVHAPLARLRLDLAAAGIAAGGIGEGGGAGDGAGGRDVRAGAGGPDAAAGLEGAHSAADLGGADAAAGVGATHAAAGVGGPDAGGGAALDRAALAELRAACAQMAAAPAAYADWADLARSIAAADRAGAGAIVHALRVGRLEAARATEEFRYACAEARWNAARRARPELDALPALDRHALVGLFRTLEKERLEATRKLVLSRHFEQMPRGTVGEMGVIRGEIGRKRGHKPVRWVMKNAGAMVQRIKPVMLMSPISVAQFLPPGSVAFDLLVIDEASQIRPEDALGVIARARQIVVVGDQKQLPPTSFFDRLADDDADNDFDEDDALPAGATAADMESILSLCEARGLRQRMLEWHYRSRAPSLIRVSNAEFYGDRLVLPPSPLQLDPDYGLKFRRVPGVYARGGSGLGRQGTNRIEAEAVVRAMAEHARAWPELSLGVVAFSKAQADMLTEVLELERRRDPVLDALLREGGAEDVFVKNIENVQGDERDVILISVGYGPQQAGGRLEAMTFGPINGEGGERRLNVLFSRARVRCEVFASFEPGDIDPGRVSREGPRVLKRFLEFAQSGILDERVATGLGADSPFEEDVAAAIRALGYLADPQVGTAGFRIDVGVRHPERPGQYLVAVECDGAAYHRAIWARERDRLRQDILENLGWRFHRIWSTDWFHHRAREIERLRSALEAARAATANGIRVRGANHGAGRAQPHGEARVAARGEAREGQLDGRRDDSLAGTHAMTRDAATADAAQGHPNLPPPVSPDGDASFALDHLALVAPAYVRAAPAVHSSLEPHEAPATQLAGLVAEIVAVEGPIHLDELARRITTAFGRARVGKRIAAAVEHAVGLALRHPAGLVRAGDFVMTPAQAESPPVRDRSAETGSLLKAASLPPVEIAAAAALIRAESGAIAPDELVRATARLLGFQRLGPELAEAIRQAVE